MLRFLKQSYQYLHSIIDEPGYRKLASHYNIQGYKRIYLVHIRKTGGTSLNKMFLGLGGNNATAIYDELAKNRRHRLIRKQKVFVGWNLKLINRGNYFYAFSHTPLHQLSLPPPKHLPCHAFAIRQKEFFPITQCF